MGLLALNAAIVACGSGGTDTFAALRGDAAYNVLIITVDTLRADRLPAYGFDGVATPAFDRLADEGIVFENAQSTTPLTLPAHTSMFTGNYPLLHGVLDNGGYLVPEEAETLAETLAASGYRTGGFVAAYVLDRRWRLNQGFDTFYDDFEIDGGGQRLIGMASLQRPANEVVDRAIDWLDEPSGDPFFLWVHLYDPHTPYDPPEPYASRHRNRPYLGEIAFTDSQIGRLLDHLEQQGLLDDTFVVVVADHGESLGEHGESEHGLFIYDAVTHVPLIIRVPFGDYGGTRRGEPTSIVDVTPTVLEMTGVGASSDLHGISLVASFDAQFEPSPRYVYSESWYARLHYGWSPLQALRGDRYKLILSSDPELYDMRQDPREADNLVGRMNTVEAELTRAAEASFAGWSAQSLQSTPTELDEATRNKLASLGYIGSFQDLPSNGGEAASPRSKIGIYNKALKARQALGREDYATAERLLLEVLTNDPGIVESQRQLGEVYVQQGRLEEAVEAYRAAIPLRPDDSYTHRFLLQALVDLGRLDEAEKAADDAIELAGPDATHYFLLGDVRGRRGNPAGAIDAYSKAIEMAPDESAAARAGMAAANFLLGNMAAAETFARAALEQNDDLPGAHFVLAELHDGRGEGRTAVAEYTRVLELAPEHVAAHFNLAMVYRKLGREDDERAHLQDALALEPRHPLANLFMARQLLRRSTDYRRAIEMVQGAIEDSLEDPDLALGYFLLADLYSRTGEPALSQRFARQGQEIRQRIER